PANAIIKKAIVKKNLRNSKIKDYVYYAYTKGVLKTQSDVSNEGSVGSFSISTSKDTSTLTIAGILENESKGYFKQPNLKKDVIIARKQSANFSSQLNTITGGRLTQNFYNENINLFGKEVPGPLSEDALSYYYYYIKDRLMINNLPVYKIYMAPDYSSNPGLTGYIYIADSTFDLIKVELGLNRAANTGGLFESFAVGQQFELQSDSIMMPANYHINATLNIFNFAKIGFEILTSLNNYEINSGLKDDFFSKATITVLNDADKKDSLYWSNLQSIPNTDEEKTAYKRIDSVSSIKKTFWDNFSFLSTTIGINDNISVSAPMGMYHFNKVEGHAIDYGIWGNGFLDQRLNTNAIFNYGFADKRVKGLFYAEYLYGDYRTHEFSFYAFDKINKLFSESSNYNEMYSTLTALISKYDFNDYYYTKGFNFKYKGEIFPILAVKIGFENNTYSNAFTNSNVTWFYKKKSFSKNLPVIETKLNMISAGFTLDFRNYIEDGYFRRRIPNSKFNMMFNGNITYSNNSIIKSGLNFTKYEASLYGNFKTFRNAGLRYEVTGFYNEGYLPYQLLNSLSGNIAVTAKQNSFRTLRLNEYVGDRTLTAFFDHNFSDELFKMLHIPFLKDSEIQLNIFVNTALSTLSDKAKSILIKPSKTFDRPFFEAGFGLGHILFPIAIDFAWKLNHRGENNFSIGLNTFLIN
ncbi:MAG: DUF5686 family protein, partial [Bacteroidota bacterium]|nr:DUF5686 family protein [Bacteroidota bacterium]